MSQGLPVDTLLHQICFSSAGFWLLATANGVYMLHSGDTAWQPMDGLSGINVLSITDAGNGKYYAGTDWEGIYIAINPIEADVHREIQSEIQVKLFPNPTTGIMTIQPASSAVLFNSLGLQILNVKGESQEIQLDLTNYPSGVYFVRVQTDAGAVTRKIVKE
jgi:hypothetical protein